MNNFNSFFKLVSVLVLFVFISENAYSQCIWQVEYSDNFEYSTVIPGYITGTTYHPSPATYAARTGSKGFYMNFVNGISSNTVVLSRPYAVCTLNSYRFKSWAKEINGGSSNVTLRVRDSNNVILASFTNNYIASAGWTQWITPTFTPSTGTVYFEVIYNSGVGNNDFGMDDLSLEVCAPPVTTQSMNFCASAVSFNLFDSLGTLTGTTGAWTGPTALANGFIGTFDPTTNTSGTYNYTISDPNPVCPDSIETFNMVVGLGPILNLGNDTSLCTNATLTLDVTNDGSTYIWQDNSTDSVFTITQAGTYWVQISDSCSVVSDTIVAEYYPYPNVFIGNDTVLCHGDTLTVDATTFNASYLWNTNDTNPTIPVQAPGNYWVSVTVNGCTTLDTIQASFDPMPSVNLGNDTTLCQGESIILHANNSNATYLWQDGSANPIYFVNSSGLFWVEASINNCATSDTINVNVILNPNPSLGNDTNLCEGETFTLNGSSPNATYTWQDGSSDSTLVVTQQGSYWVEVTNVCATVTETIDVSFNPIPTVDLGSDFEICEGLEATLIATTANGSYLWDDNSTISTRTVFESGMYYVLVTVAGCVGQDSIHAEFLPSPSVHLGTDSILCSNQPATLNANTPSATYLWMDNTIESTYTVSTAGEYWVEVSIGPCSSSDTINFEEIDCDVILEMPNIFTPNDDGFNDQFTPITVEGVEEMNTTIYSRWGNEMFYSPISTIDWNGDDKNGQPSPSGVYFWVVTITGKDGSKHEYNGEFSLVR